VGKYRHEEVSVLYSDQLIFFRHSFKLLPNIGKHVVELIEGSLAEDLAHAWRWRPGGDALRSRRGAPPKDLADMPGWKHDP
jgi:sarcosine oxidase / L-pipecolate oxidase